MNLYEELQYRNLIKDVSNVELAKKLLNEKSSVFYCGFDPTAESLQMGNFVQIIRMMLLQKYGHKPIALIGGATGLIGDPKEKSERKLLKLEKVLDNSKKVEIQIRKFLKDAIIVNNYDWISKINTIEFLRDYGKHFNINYMLDKETVAKRLETGISYTEFSYMILQSIDYLNLFKEYNCKIQFGGSDQWGNITAGLELIRKVTQKEVLAISSPLLTKSDGTKFGKSESGALYLDENLTSSYELYQYLINTPDEDVINYIKTLTLLEKKDIDILEEKVKTNPELREAQKALAKEVVTLVHSEESYNQALKITQYLFEDDLNKLTEEELILAFKNVLTFEVKENINIVDLLVETEILKSKREAREFISNNAISINSEKQQDLEKVLTKKDCLYNKYLIIRKGKKNYFLVIMV